MAFTDIQKQWLEQASSLASTRVDWQHQESVKSQRLTSVRQSLDEHKESLRALNDFEVEVKRAGKLGTLRQALQGNKTVKALYGTEDGWQVTKEFDPGHYKGRIASEDGALPPEIQRRVDAALRIIQDLQDQLQHGSVDPSRHDAIRAEIDRKLKDTSKVDQQMLDAETKKRIDELTAVRVEEAKQEARPGTKKAQQGVDEGQIRKEVEAKVRQELEDKYADEVRAEVARDPANNCTVRDIREIELSGSVPREKWDEIRKAVGKFDADIETRSSDLEARSKRLNDNGQDMPAKSRKRLEGQIKELKPQIEALRKEREQKVAELAQAHGATPQAIEEIVGLPPVFDDLELRRELWQPLVREGIIPAALVPDEYSEIVQQFAGADELYKARIESEYEKDPRRDTKEKIAFAKTLTSNILGVAAAGFGGVAAVGTGTEQAGVAAVGTWGAHVVNGVKAFADSMYEGAGKLVARQYEDLWDVAGSAIGGVITTAMPGDNANLGWAISGAIVAGGKASGSLHKNIIGPLARGGQPDWHAAALSFGEVVSAAFVAASSAGSHEKEKDDSYDDAWTNICTQVGARAKTVVAAVLVGKDVVKALSSDPPNVQAVLGSVEKAVQEAVTMALKDAVDKMTERTTSWDGQTKTDLTDESKDELGREKGSTAAYAMKDGIEAGIGTGLLDKVKNLIPSGKALESAMQAAEGAATDKELVQAGEAFRRELVLGFGFAANDPDAMKLAADGAAIDKLIAQIERDRALIKMAEAVFDTAFKTAGEFFEPLKAISAGKDFVKQVIIAVQRGLEFRQWRELNRDALTACSAQGFAFANRVMNLKVQITDHTLDAACELAKIIGAAGSAAGLAGFGVGAQAGKVITKSADALQGIKNVILQVYKKNELRAAWKLYLRALANPQDRRLKYEVLKANPTLSKYAMAYAAVFEDDIIARHGLRACGLSEESLKHPDTNADKVVAYLETKFDEDPVLIRKLTVKTWQPKKFGSELSQDGWTANRQAAVDHKDLKLDPASVGGVEAALMDYFTKQRRHELAVAELNVAQQEYDIAAADYFPALDELIADRKRVRLATGELDVQVQVLATMESDANDLTRKKLPERDVAALRDLVTSAGAMSAELNASVLRADALEQAVQKFDGLRSAYSPIAERYVKVVDANPDLEAFAAAAETLRQTLRSARPLTTADPSGLCQPFADYLEALALRTRMAENEARQRLDLCAARSEEAREDLAAAQDSSEVKRDRTALEKLRKDATEARERARIVQTRLIDLLKETEAGPRTGAKKGRKQPV